jgi:hypothetical protein
MSICLDPEMCHKCSDYCERLLHFFVQQFSKLYGENQVVYNVHCLTHLVDDVRHYGCLDSTSAFPNDNYLGNLKGMIRKGSNPVSQIVNRLTEQNNSATCRNARATDCNPCKKAHRDGPLPCGMAAFEQYKQYKSNTLFLSCDFGDNCVEVERKIGIVRNILRKTGDSGHSCSVVFSPFERKESLYKQPLLSENLGIFSLSKLCDTSTVHSLSDISRKYMLLPLPNETGYAGFPLQEPVSMQYT